jgi:hypothetical protein
MVVMGAGEGVRRGVEKRKEMYSGPVLRKEVFKLDVIDRWSRTKKYQKD